MKTERKNLVYHSLRDLSFFLAEAPFGGSPEGHTEGARAGASGGGRVVGAVRVAGPGLRIKVNK